MSVTARLNDIATEYMYCLIGSIIAQPSCDYVAAWHSFHYEHLNSCCCCYCCWLTLGYFYSLDVYPQYCNMGTTTLMPSRTKTMVEKIPFLS